MPTPNGSRVRCERRELVRECIIQKAEKAEARPSRQTLARRSSVGTPLGMPIEKSNTYKPRLKAKVRESLA